MKRQKVKLDSDEKKLLRSFESGEWKSVVKIKEKKKQALNTAAKTLRKAAG
jgi:hypothetical protein